MSQKQVQKQGQTSKEAEAELPDAPPKHVDARIDEGKIEDVLDEIDDLLEEDAEAQKGGE